MWIPRVCVLARQFLCLPYYIDLDHPQTITRPRDESKEDKKARKAAVKADRQARRLEKKFTKEQFGAEKKTQMRTMANREQRVKKL